MNLNVKDAQLYYSSRGRGPVCLVLCSFGTKPLERQMPAALDQDLNLVFLDLRGSGLSTGAASDLSFEVLSEDLEAVRRHLGVDRVAVFGHSAFGALAIEHARRCPEGVSHVIAVGAPPSGDMAALAAQSRSYFEEAASDERKQVLHENMARLTPGASPGETMFAQTPMRFFDPRFDVGPLFAEAVLRPEIIGHVLGSLMARFDVAAAAGALKVPLFLALGRHDYIVPWVLWQNLVPTLPTATVQIFEQSGHQPFVEEPDRFTEAIRAWMRRR